MNEAGNDFGPSTPYGSTLIKCGQTHQKLGLTYKDFIQSAAMGYMQPLKSFLEGEMKSITVNINLLMICFFLHSIPILERTSYIRNEAS
jgi:endophilin-B